MKDFPESFYRNGIVGGILREIRPSLCQRRSHLKIRLLSTPCSRASCVTLILRYIYCLVFQGASSDRFRWRFAVRGRVVGKIYSLVLPNGDCPLRRRRKRTDKKSQRSLNNDDMLDEWYNIFRKSSVCSPEEEQSPVKVPEYYCLYLVA